MPWFFSMTCLSTVRRASEPCILAAVHVATLCWMSSTAPSAGVSVQVRREVTNWPVSRRYSRS